MFASLGEIEFEVITSPETFVSTQAFDYAEHKIVEAPPRLQWMAAGLEELNLEIGLHAGYTNPLAQLTALRAAASAHQAMALIFANGVHRGYFVITQLTETARHLADDGTPIALTLRLQLKQWILGAEIDPKARPKPKTPPPGIIQVAPAAAPQPTPFNPNQPIGPHNLLPTSALVTLGALPAGTYVAPAYSTPGVSPLVSNPPATGASGPNVQAGDVPATEIVGG